MKETFKEPLSSVGLLLLRIAVGGFMMTHGIPKFMNFEAKSAKFMNFLGLGSEISLGLTVFAELGCAFLILIGLFTRWATLPLIFVMGVAAFVAHGPDPFGKKEMALLYLLGYVCIAFTGPGRFSLDYLSKNRGQ